MAPLTDKDREEFAFADTHSVPDVYINGARDTCWFPWVGPIEMKPFRFESKSGQFVVALRTAEDTWLGKHRHRGLVTAYTISGNWRYSEYEWVAGPGDYVVEHPGTSHTLFLGAGAEVIFTVDGSLEFLNDDGSLKETMDIFSFAKLYYDYCAEKGTSVNKKLWF